MHIWYVKARHQTDHNERAKTLNIPIILEDTSAQVRPSDPLPHGIVQVMRLDDNEELTAKNIVLTEPVNKSQIDQIADDDKIPN